MSVWVEICSVWAGNKRILSRSTWACELKSLLLQSCVRSNLSRSTWACELKFAENYVNLARAVSRSTWACELKFPVWPLLSEYSSHAPRERVSWNPIFVCGAVKLSSHAPRERVSWNKLIACLLCAFIRHAPRERVSWNALDYISNQNNQSRSTWACELKFPCSIHSANRGTVTLHVSVWVEMQYCTL